MFYRSLIVAKDDGCFECQDIVKPVTSSGAAQDFLQELSDPEEIAVSFYKSDFLLLPFTWSASTKP